MRSGSHRMRAIVDARGTLCHSRYPMDGEDRLPGDAGIDWVKGRTVNNESVRDEGIVGGILPRFILGGGPKTCLPGIHRDGTIDIEW